MSHKARWNLMLAVATGDLAIRAWTREDFDRLSAWPSYPRPFEPFNMRCRTLPPSQRDDAFHAKNGEPDRLDLVIDHAGAKTVGWLGLSGIDWKALTIGNMGIRIHPDWCDRKVGSVALAAVVDWCFQHGVRAIRLDVAATNPRAVRCYEKCGFAVTGEFWRSDPALTPDKLATADYAFMRPHVRFNGPVAEVRFHWMEIRTPV